MLKHIALAVCTLSFCFGRAAAKSPAHTSSVADQASVEITVYNSNLALVKDTRTVLLPSGEGELRFMDVAAHIIPETVRAKSLNRPADFGDLRGHQSPLVPGSRQSQHRVGQTKPPPHGDRPVDLKQVSDPAKLILRCPARKP